MLKHRQKQQKWSRNKFHKRPALEYTVWTVGMDILCTSGLFKAPGFGKVGTIIISASSGGTALKMKHTKLDKKKKTLVKRIKNWSKSIVDNRLTVHETVPDDMI